MNKYQEALKRYESHFLNKEPFNYKDQLAIQHLREVVDKGTAVKPILQNNLDWNCPKCGAYHTKFVMYYCEYCGQKIDWSEE